MAYRDRMFKKDRLLVIAPHPDDEIIGCGGFITRVKEEGGKVFVLFLTVGGTKDYTKGKRRSISASDRIKEIEKVTKFLKFDGWHLAFPGDKYHLRLDQLPQRDLIDSIENGPVSLNRQKPTIVAIPSPSSYNQDHRVCAQAAFAATRPMPKEFKPLSPLVISYEEPTDFWTPDEPSHLNFFVTLTERDLKAKITALKLYKTQVRSGNHPRSPKTLKNLAQLRGSQAGASLAEGFWCYRQII